jgi:hypothetical protein
MAMATGGDAAIAAEGRGTGCVGGGFLAAAAAAAAGGLATGSGRAGGFGGSSRIAAVPLEENTSVAARTGLEGMSGSYAGGGGGGRSTPESGASSGARSIMYRRRATGSIAR